MNPAVRMETAADWLLRLREDTLSEQELSQWLEWCEAHPENLAAFEELQALWQAAGDHAPRETKVRERVWVRPVALAASVAVLVAGAAFVVLNRAPGTVQTMADVDRVATPVAQNRDAILPDGSQVTIGARSLLEVQFTPSGRQLELSEGQAYFKVERDRTRPFVVDAAGLRIQAIGTAFDVRHGVNAVIVTVQEGAVKVSRAGGAYISQLNAGRQLTFDLAAGQAREVQADPAVAVAWRSGRLEFTGDSLETVIASVNRYSPRPVVLGDPSLGGLKFTGTVFVDSIDASLDALEQVFPLSIHRDGQRIVLEALPLTK